MGVIMDACRLISAHSVMPSAATQNSSQEDSAPKNTKAKAERWTAVHQHEFLGFTCTQESDKRLLIFVS